MNVQFRDNRDFMKTGAFAEVMVDSDQARGIPFPSHGTVRGGPKIRLPEFTDAIVQPSYLDLLLQRRSVRDYSGAAMTQEQLAFLLWSMNSIQAYRGDSKAHTLRPVPSGGARHSFEIYFAALNVEGLKPGLYHYLPLEDVGEQRATIEYLGELPDDGTILNMVVGQEWATHAGALFVISSIPYRGEWRYAELAHRMLLIDLGHLGQDFMLSATALGLGSCEMAGYDQQLCDQVFGLNGKSEFSVLAMAAGVAAATD